MIETSENQVEKGTFHYRSFLKFVLQRRVSKNASYSLRAFARDLKISSAQLSKILNGKKNLSAAQAEEVSVLLFSEIASRSAFVSLVANCNNLENKGALIEREHLFNKLSGSADFTIETERTNFLSSWLIFSVFEILSLKNAPNTVDEVSKTLSAPIADVRQAFQRLQDLNLVAESGGRYRRIQKRFRTSNNVPSRAIRELHRQFLGKAIRAIDRQPVGKRYFRAVTVGLNSQYLDELRQLIDGFLFEVSKRELKSENDADCLYQINFQMFDLIEDDNEKEESDVA